jgi:hypothetical protein
MTPHTPNLPLRAGGIRQHVVRWDQEDHAMNERPPLNLNLVTELPLNVKGEPTCWTFRRERQDTNPRPLS